MLLKRLFLRYSICTLMNVLELFEKITVFVFDIDGVLTDGMLLVQENGELLRRMNIKDGYALQLAVRKRYKVWVISGGRSAAVKLRLANLGVTDVYIGVKDKRTLLEGLMNRYKVTAEQVLYMGDDMPDIEAMQIAGLPCCPQDAIPEVKQVSRYIARQTGGAGCVREVIEKVLKIAGDWNEDDLPHR